MSLLGAVARGVGRGMGLGSLGSLGAIQAGQGRTWWPQVNVTKVGCKPDRTWSIAPGEYVQLKGNVQNCLHIAFPKSYFDWQKQELQKLINNKPSANTAVVPKVLYALDVWARIQYSLFSFNIPLGAYNMRTGTASRAGAFKWVGGAQIPDNPVLVRLKAASDEFTKYAGWDRDSGITSLKYEFANKFIKEQIRTAPLRAGPFMSIVPLSYGTFGRSVNYDNTMRWRVERDCIPWMAGGDNLPSLNNKDASFVQLNKNNPTMMRAIREWRLYSLMDFFPWKPYRNMLEAYDEDDRIPYEGGARFLGRLDNRTTLQNYMRNVAQESPRSIVEGTPGGWYPTVQYVIDHGLPKLANVIIGTDYEKTIQAHVRVWAMASAPPLDGAGNLKRIDAGHWGDQPQQLPMTCEDYNDSLKGRAQNLKNRQKAAVADHDKRCECDPNVADCSGWEQEYATDLCKGQEQLLTTMEETFPAIGYFRAGYDAFVMWLIDVLPGAQGADYIPYRVMHHPFTRNIANPPALDTAATGSTQFVLTKISRAIDLIQAMTGLQLEPWSVKNIGIVYEKTACDDTEMDSMGVMRCVSTSQGDCYEIKFDRNGEAYCLSKLTPEDWLGDPAKVCAPQVNAIAAKHRILLTPDDSKTAMNLCAMELRNEKPAGATETFIAEAKKRQEALARMPIMIPPTPKMPPIPWGWIGVAVVGAVVLKRSRS